MGGSGGEIEAAARALFAACGLRPPVVIPARDSADWSDTAAVVWKMSSGGASGPWWAPVLVAPALALSAGAAAAADWAASLVAPGTGEAAARAAFAVSAALALALILAPSLAARRALKARWAAILARNGASAAAVDLGHAAPSGILRALDRETALRGGAVPPRDRSWPIRLGRMESDLASPPVATSLAWVGDADPTFDTPCLASLWDLHNAVDEAVIVGNVVVATPRSNGPSRRAEEPVRRILQDCF